MNANPGPQRKQLVIGCIASAAILAGIISLTTGRDVDRDRETLRLHEDCGAAMADLAQRALGKGKALLVLEHDGRGLPPEKQEWMQKQTQGFYAEFGTSVEITKAGVGNDDARALRARMDGTASNPNQWRRDAYTPLAEQAPKVDAIVSFVGEPIVGAKGPEEWKHLPPVVCFSFAGDDVATLMEAGVVASAIVPRRTAMSIKASKGKSWFHVMYEIITPGNLEEWAQEDME